MTAFRRDLVTQKSRCTDVVRADTGCRRERVITGKEESERMELGYGGGSAGASLGHRGAARSADAPRPGLGAPAGPRLADI